MVFLFHFNREEKSSRPSARPSSKVSAYSTITRITKKQPWRQQHRRQHVHFTDADKKTTHSTVTVIQNLVIAAMGAALGIREVVSGNIQSCSVIPSTASTSATTVQYSTTSTLHSHPHQSHPNPINQSQNYAQSRDRRTQISHPQDYYGLGYPRRRKRFVFQHSTSSCQGNLV